MMRNRRSPQITRRSFHAARPLPVVVVCVGLSALSMAEPDRSRPPSARESAQGAPAGPSAPGPPAQGAGQAGTTVMEGQLGCGVSEFNKAKSFRIPLGETVRGDRYYVGNGAEIDGVLDGDFFAFSGQN